MSNRKIKCIPHDIRRSEIDYYSKYINEVKTIALNGWKRGHHNYNEKIITNYMLHKAFNKNIELTWPEVTYC